MKVVYHSYWRRGFTILALMLPVAAHAAQTAPAALVSSDAARTGPTIIVISGDNQAGTPGEFNSKPFDIAVWNAAGTEPLVDTEVTFTVQFGGGLLASSKDAALPSSALTLKTDQDGTVQAYYKQPFVPGLMSQIKAAAAGGELTVATRSLAIGESPDDIGTTQNEESSSASDAMTGSHSKSARSDVVIAFVTAHVAGTQSSATTQGAHPGHGKPSRIVLKTRHKGFFAVDPSTWAIAPTTAP